MRRLYLMGLSLVFGTLLCLPTLTQAAPTAADKSYAAAMQFYTVRSDQLAVEEFQKFLTTYATDPRVHHANFILGRIHRRQGKLDLALASFAQVINKAVGDDNASLRAEAHYQTAECYQQQGDLDRAQRFYGNCVKISTDLALTVRAQYWQGECLYQLGKYDEALPLYRKVVEKAPKDPLAPWALYAVGMIELSRNRHAEAVTALDTVLTEYKDTEVLGEVRLALGAALAGRARTAAADAPERTNDYTRAAEILTQVREDIKSTVPARRQAVLLLARCAYEQQQFSKAAELYGAAVDLTSDNTEALEARLHRGHALYNEKNYALAIVEYGKVAAGKDATLAEQGLYWQGISQYQQATATKAILDYTVAVQTLGRCLAKIGTKTAQAPRVSLYLAYCYEDLSAAGDAAYREKAVKAFKDILEKWPAAREAKEAEAGIGRMTGTMTVPELVEFMHSTPGSVAVWNVALRLASEQFRAGQYADAIVSARQVIDNKPAADVLAQAYYLTGAAHQKSGAFDKAAEAYQQAAKVAGTGETALLAQRGLTQCYLDAKKFTQAEESATALLPMLTNDEEKAEATMYLAEAALGQRKYAEAMASYRDVAVKYPTTSVAPFALMGRGWAAELSKDADSAIAAYRDLIKTYTDHKLVGDALFRLGVALAARRDFDGALAAFTSVPAAYKPDQVAYAMAGVYWDQLKYDEAIRTYESLAEKHPTSVLAADSLYRIGEYWLEQKKNAEAMRYLNRALEKAQPGPFSALVGYKLGVSAFFSEKYDLAADAFGKLVANYPNSEYAADSLFWKGQALERNLQYTAARDAYLQYATKYATQGLVLDALLGVGRAAYLAKQYGMARTDLQRTLERCEEEAKNPKNQALVDRAKNVQPEAQFYIGQTYSDEKKYTDALRAYVDIALYPLEPWYSRSLLEMARCSALTANRESARNFLRNLMRDFPKSEAAQQASAVAKEYNILLDD